MGTTHGHGSPSQHVSSHAKLIQPTALFSNSKHLFVCHFASLADRLT